MTRVRLTGINKVRKRLADGSEIHMHYLRGAKGAPAFWRSDSGVRLGSEAYVSAYHAAQAPRASDGLFRDLLTRYLKAPEFTALSPRYRRDIQASIRAIDAKFGDAPLAAFDDPRIRRVVLDWRDTATSAKTGDTRVQHLQKIVAWGYDRAILRDHHLQRIKSVHRSDRSRIIWTDAEIETFVAGAPEHIARILLFATETGMRPGDLVALGPEHLHRTPGGHRLVTWTRKSRARRAASVPVTERLARLIATLPAEGPYLTTLRGTAWSHEDKLGRAVGDWRDRLGIRAELHLYDARGTAATRLLNAGAEVREIAAHMGWSFKNAVAVIETYAAIHPDMTDALHEKLRRARG